MLSSPDSEREFSLSALCSVSLFPQLHLFDLTRIKDVSFIRDGHEKLDWRPRRPPHRRLAPLRGGRLRAELDGIRHRSPKLINRWIESLLYGHIYIVEYSRNTEREHFVQRRHCEVGHGAVPAEADGVEPQDLHLFVVSDSFVECELAQFA